MARKDIIVMTQEELKRLHVIQKIREKKLKQVEAAGLLNLSDRQIRRIVGRVKREGEKGIIHKARGRFSNRRFPEKVREKVIRLYRGRYKGFGPTLASEKLFEIDKVKISDETLRLWLIEEGEWRKRRKCKKHRNWRERKHFLGEMVQVDGSHHDWFEGRGSMCVLMGYIDDATSKRYARFYDYEGTIPAFDSLKRYIKRYGIPKSLYLDKHSTYKSTAKPTIEDELNNREHLSQLERAARELGIEIIHANSPQAKGRAERSFKTYQDRLVKEMRLKGIKTVEEANKLLGKFLPGHNRRFSVKAIKGCDLHRSIPRGMDLDSILCIKTEHPLRNDFTIAHDKKLYQILDHINAKKVTVEEKVNGSMFITFRGKCLKYKQVFQRPAKKEPKKDIFKIKRVWSPPIDHHLKKAMFERRIRQNNVYSKEENIKQKEKELVLTKT